MTDVGANRGRRKAALVVSAGLLAAGSGVLLLSGRHGAPDANEAHSQLEIGEPRGSTAAASREAPRRPPVFVPPPSGATVAPPAPAPDPEQAKVLAKELATFTDDQIRAELASIALSQEGVSIVAASCKDGRCRATAESAQREPLERFIGYTSARFKGFVKTTYFAAGANGRPVTRAEMEIGVP